MDVLLTLLAVACSGLLGVMGFAVSTHPPQAAVRNMALAAFFLLSLVGGGAVVWQSIHEAAEQRRAEARAQALWAEFRRSQDETRQANRAAREAEDKLIALQARMHADIRQIKQDVDRLAAKR